jgi:hypothetical protein
VTPVNDTPVANDAVAGLNEDGANGTVNILTTTLILMVIQHQQSGHIDLDQHLGSKNTITEGVWTYDTTTGVVTFDQR